MTQGLIINISKYFVLTITTIVVTASGTYYYKKNKDLINIGNYESYIDPSLIVSSLDNFNIRFDNFENDKKVGDQFKNKTYDAAIVSNSMAGELIENKLVKQIDWKKLNLSYSGKKITDVNSAKNIYSSQTKKVINKNPKYLQYGFPYFLSSFSFYYRGEKIQELQESKTWNEILKIIVKQERFKSKNNMPKIGMIDDARTIFSLAQLVTDQNDINILTEEEKSLKHMKKKFDSLNTLSKKNLGKNSLFLNSDSAVLLDALANGTIEGAFMYNGDAAFAVKGGNNEVEHEAGIFHTIKPNRSLYILDLLVISKKITKQKEERIYRFIKKLFFDSLGKQNIFEKDADEYRFWDIKNFVYVNYTPVLEAVRQKLKDDSVNSDLISPNEYKDFLKEILFLNDDSSTDQMNSVFCETNLGTKANINMILAFENWKSNI